MFPPSRRGYKTGDGDILQNPDEKEEAMTSFNICAGCGRAFPRYVENEFCSVYCEWKAGAKERGRERDKKSI